MITMQIIEGKILVEPGEFDRRFLHAVGKEIPPEGRSWRKAHFADFAFYVEMPYYETITKLCAEYG